jgi:hypothetical protein
MLETGTNAYLNTEDNRLQSDKDSLYSVIGILKQLQPLGDRYVLLGELRGDLTEVTENADMDMQAIAGFTATADNSYLSTREYYAVINNCNYFLQHVDTTIVSAGRRVMLGEYVVVKAIRAWTYLQLGLNYGKAVWLTDPLLTIDDMNKEYEELPLETLLPRLIADLSPYPGITDLPGYGNINGVPASFLFIPVPVLLADLFLWQGTLTGDRAAYTEAARCYYQWFRSEGYFRPAYLYNSYMSADFMNVSTSWTNVYSYSFTGEHVSVIAQNSKFTESPKIYPTSLWCIPSNTAETYRIKPSQAAMNLWQNEMYTYYRETQKDILYTRGDLRGRDIRPQSLSTNLGSYNYVSINGSDSVPYIAKYGYYLSGGGSVFLAPNVSIYRSGLLYLRYAEVLNALGKPSLAFAVLKYGLKREVLIDAHKVAPGEIDPLPDYCNFMDESFSVSPSNRGLHARGSGDVERDTVYYAFTPQTLAENAAYYGMPAKLENKQDSMEFVNVMICKELGLETAFEGNRFHDLMRLSRFYEQLTGKTDFLSQWVGRRNPALEGKLLDSGNWYLPRK